MERVFTQNVGKFNVGDVRDYPSETWEQISVSARRPLDTFTKTVGEVATSAVTGDAVVKSSKKSK